MKRKILPVICLVMSILVFCFIKYAYADTVDTYHTNWTRVRAAAEEDASTFAGALALDTNEGDFDSKPATAFHIIARTSNGQFSLPSSPGAGWFFAFFGTDAADETFSFTMVGWSRDNGMAQVICEGNGVLGTQDVVIEPNGDSIANAFWADTITLDEKTKWPSINTYNVAGDNEVGFIAVDLAGIEYVKFYIYDVAGGAEAASIGVYGRRF